MESNGNDWQVRSAVIRGLRSAWIDCGPENADLVLLLHGYPDTPECWEYQIRELAKTYRVIAPYMRGVGESEPGDSVRRYGTKPVTLDLFAILSSVDPLAQRKIFLVGHDLGAVYAWNLASSLCDRVAGLVIINGLSLGQMLKRWRYPEQLRKSWYIYLMQIPMLPELFLKMFPSRLLRIAHRLGRLEESRRPEQAKVLKALRYPINQYRSFFREIPDVLSNPTTKVGCPVLVLWGSEDAFLMPPRMEELKTDAEDVTVRILEGGHWLQRQLPETINDLISGFLGECDAKNKHVVQKRIENNGPALNKELV